MKTTGPLIRTQRYDEVDAGGIQGWNKPRRKIYGYHDAANSRASLASAPTPAKQQHQAG